ncbi:hypothetical protein BJ546DRAFT_361737 [Cryomyces antarcticus]
MRYQLWDVLLFPEPSDIPIQEFKTACFVTQDPESGHLPVLTCFVPSLPRGSPFKVSIHSWGRQKLSAGLRSLGVTHERLLFGVRVLVDGECIASEVFSPEVVWPQLIDLSDMCTAKGQGQQLRFPPFHQEVLAQSHWTAGESLGRIKVIVSEGYQGLGQGKVQFERVNDIVCFSFQHAPLDVLEQSAIAWPNASMWSTASQLPSNARHYQSPYGVGFTDSHTQRWSPLKDYHQPTTNGVYYPEQATNTYPFRGLQCFTDPFMDQYSFPVRQLSYTSKNDLSMRTIQTPPSTTQTSQGPSTPAVL